MATRKGWNRMSRRIEEPAGTPAEVYYYWHKRWCQILSEEHREEIVRMAVGSGQHARQAVVEKGPVRQVGELVHHGQLSKLLEPLLDGVIRILLLENLYLLLLASPVYLHGSDGT